MSEQITVLTQTAYEIYKKHGKTNEVLNLCYDVDELIRKEKQ